MAVADKLAHHDLRIDEVLGATEADKSDFQRVRRRTFEEIRDSFRVLRRGFSMAEWREQTMGEVAEFLLPSLKVTARDKIDQVHSFLMDNFDGYTAQAGNIFGYWKDEKGEESYGEHRAFTVALADESKLPRLKSFLSRMARELDEDCIYLRVGGHAYLVYSEG
jgi:hypothetical protein